MVEWCVCITGSPLLTCVPYLLCGLQSLSLAASNVVRLNRSKTFILCIYRRSGGPMAIVSTHHSQCKLDLRSVHINVVLSNKSLPFIRQKNNKSGQKSALGHCTMYSCITNNCNLQLFSSQVHLCETEEALLPDLSHSNNNNDPGTLQNRRKSVVVRSLWSDVSVRER